jgi:hypothetical protein
MLVSGEGLSDCIGLHGLYYVDLRARSGTL